MSGLILIATLLFCIAIALAAIWISYQAITTYDTAFHKYYFYYLIAFYGFAFYGFWAQLGLRALTNSLAPDGESILLFTYILEVMAIPFLLVSWLMLVNMGYALVERIPKKKAILWLALLLAVGLPLIWTAYTVSGREYVFPGLQRPFGELAMICLAELACLLFFSGIALRGLKKSRNPKKQIAGRFTYLMILGFVLRVLAIPFLFMGNWYAFPALLLHFLSNFAPLMYLKIHSDTVFTPVFAGHPNDEKKALLFEKYQISKREKEIVDKICEGKTNQQIADELFISLQTVKDHTHRIYTKIGIHSRIKLIQLINGISLSN